MTSSAACLCLQICRYVNDTAVTLYEISSSRELVLHVQQVTALGYHAVVPRFGQLCDVLIYCTHLRCCSVLLCVKVPSLYLCASRLPTKVMSSLQSLVSCRPFRRPWDTCRELPIIEDELTPWKLIKLVKIFTLCFVAVCVFGFALCSKVCFTILLVHTPLFLSKTLTWSVCPFSAADFFPPTHHLVK